MRGRFTLISILLITALSPLPALACEWSCDPSTSAVPAAAAHKPCHGRETSDAGARLVSSFHECEHGAEVPVSMVLSASKQASVPAPQATNRPAIFASQPQDRIFAGVFDRSSSADSGPPRSVLRI